MRANLEYGPDSVPRAEMTTDDVLAEADLSGQLILVTGGTTGLGYETARALASHNAEVIITGRSEEKGKTACEKLRSETGNTSIDYGVVELGSLKSIRSFVGEFLKKHDRLNVLINNAGVMACPLGRTEDGFELQFGTNHLGHFLLSELLVPALKGGAPSRVVSLSSRGHIFSEINFDDPNFEKREYHKWVSYGQAKTANALFAVGFNQKYTEAGIEAFAVHPGMIMTDLARHMTEEDFAFLGVGNSENDAPSNSKTVPQGAATSVWAATAKELSGKGGAYLEDCSIAPINDDAKKPGGVRSYAIDEEKAQKLWELSANLVG